MDFHDYVVNYPLQDDKDIQQKTTKREEFFELRGGPVENIPKKGEFFKHQDLFTRYLRQYDRIFNIHETGTGKTGSILDASETFRRDKIGIKQVVVLQPGNPTLEDFRSQIVKFFPEEYDDDTSNSEVMRKRIISRKIEKWYKLNTYISFSNMISRMRSEEIVEEFSDTLFFLDEAHRMRNYGESDKNDENIYTAIWRLLHTAQRTKIVIATATPLVNSVNDFVPLLNLLLSSDYQLPIKGWDYSKVSLKQLEPYFRGKISFVRSLDTGIEIVNKGSKIDYTHLYYKPDDNASVIPSVSKSIDSFGNIVDDNEPIQVKNKVKGITFDSDVDIVLIPMSYSSGKRTKQYEVYNVAKTQKQSFELASRESSVFVFPNNEWGTSAFKKYIKEEEGKYKFRNDEIKNFLLDKDKPSLPKLFELSSKFYHYISKELKASNNEHPGSSFCYLEFVSGSGAILLGLILELFGFENFTRKSSVFIRDKGTRKVQKHFKKKKRFALITSKTENTDKILELFNSDDNIDGEYLQIVIASKMARDGINLANVLRGYIMSPGWHESGMYQAMSRFIRATSHEKLLERDNNVKVEIFKLASCLDSKVFDNKVDLDKIKTNSIDVFNYIKSEEKDLYNRIVLRDMKAVAFDAVLNYKRNHRETDEDGSKQADYGDKFPETWSGMKQMTKNELIKNTKKLLYYQKNIERIDKLAKANLMKFKVLSISDILKFMSDNNIEPYYVYYYIDNVLPNVVIYDSFGTKRRILQDNNVFYLDNMDYHYTLSKPNFLQIDVTADPQTDVIDFYERMEQQGIDKIESHIRDMIWKLDGKNKPILGEIIPNQEYIRTVIEDCIVNIRNGSDDPIKNKIYELFIHYINKSDYPTRSVEEVKEAYESTSSKSGRVAKKYSATKLTKLNFIKSDTSKETTYYHFFNNVLETTNIANIFRREDNKVRILKHDSNVFEDADVNELPIFQSYYKQDIEKWIKPYEVTLQSGVTSYGTISRDNKFRIIKPPFKTSKGTVCGTNKDVPYEILKKINLSTDNIEMLNKIIVGKNNSLINESLTADKDNMDNFIFPEEYININELRHKYFWKKILNNSSAKEICKYLQEYYKYKNKLLYTL